MNRFAHKAQRGYVLIMVLVVLLVLTLLVAGLYSATEDSRFTAQTMMAQRIAAARADQAAQIAIARIRSGAFTANQLMALQYCTAPITQLRTGDCLSTDSLTDGLHNGPVTDDYENGGGAQYQFWIYKEANPDGSDPIRRWEVFNIYAEGYFGKDPTVPSFTVAAIQAEITLPGANAGTPVFDGDYGVIH